MTKYDRAVKAIEHAAKRGYTPEQTARLLNVFELLADDLPAPTYDMRDPKWQAQYEDDWDNPEAPSIWDATPFFSVGVFPGDNTITIWDDGEPIEPLTIDEVRSLRLALHAAEQTAKEQA
ncbi:hypothetical protein HMPREF2526_06175 [Corynebacterium sp. HMSC070E08]|uniref:hypothetical protein n=1 Tax=Corynebacterium sp. HMSC070E08 TaxID=1715006 RepID=UPI0008A54321|nr:hypothetical protein [Corynebacterium sp. HMSC070E08]OFN80071.1 hypothetical protein HMPREF2526_06175 [Corynebacterium sp. HMSC070E08]